MNKKEAEKDLENKLNGQAKRFCPLIKENCVMNCICLVSEISVNKFDSSEKHTPIVYCNNNMFFGD